MRILIQAPNQVQRALQSLRLIAAICDLEPALQVDVICNRDVAGLFKASPLVVNTITSEIDSDTIHIGKIWQMVQKLKEAEYERVYHLDIHSFYAFATYFIGIRHRYGFKSIFGHACSMLYTRTAVFTPANRQRLTGLRDWLRLALPEANMIQIRQRCQVVPSLHPRTYDPDFIRRKHGISALAPIIVFAAGQGSKSPKKPAPDQTLLHWPSRYFAELSLRYVDQYSAAQSVFMGDIADRPRATETMTMTTLASHNLCGVTNIAESISIVSTAQICISADPFWLDLARSLQVTTIDLNESSSPELALSAIAHAFKEGVKIQSRNLPELDDFGRDPNNDDPNGDHGSNSGSAPDTPSVY